MADAMIEAEFTVLKSVLTRARSKDFRDISGSIASVVPEEDSQWNGAPVL